MKRLPVLVCWLLVLAILVAPAPAAATVTAQFWDELGGSASGDGVSLAQQGVPLAVPGGNRNVWLAVGPDGRQVVAYVDGDRVLVRRWNGATWDLILGPGLASGNVPQLAIDANGRVYLAWRQFSGTTSTWEVFLLALDPGGTTWQPLGSSGSGGGITGAEGAAGVPAFSLALAADGTPYIAYQTTVLANTDFTTQASGLSQGTQQVYVRRWTGTAWAFVGSGREGGGASNALTFHFTNADGSGNFAVHGAEYPILAIGADGNPLVVFIYTNAFTSGNPPEFNGENDDLYAVHWTGTAWAPLGPALPTAPAGAGLGAPGGITNTPGWIREVSHDRLVRHSLAIDHDGAPILAWGETTASDGFRRIYVYRWDGTTWHGMGTTSGEIDMIAYAYDTSLAIGRDGPILAWPRGGDVQSWVNVLAWSPSEGRWHELGAGSASGQGISAPNDAGYDPRIAVNAAGVPSVAWIDATPPVPQAYLRAYLEQSLPDLTVSSVSAPATVPAGQPFTVSAVVHNAGTAAAPASTVTLYLGTGTTRASGDVALGSVASPNLALAASATVSTTVTMPAGTASGPYHVVAVVDEANTVTELSDANNTGASGAVTVPPPPAPDLDITALSTPASAAAGASLSVQHTVANVGTAATGSFAVRFYLSTDQVLDAGDVLLGTRAFTGLAAGASRTDTTALTLPANTTAPATYHVIALAALDQGTDADPSNNGAVSPAIDVTSRVPASLPDLTAGDIVLPATAQAGRPLAVRHTVRNVGPVAAGAFTVRFYLSTDDVFDAGDTLLGSRMLGGLAAGASSTAVSTFTLPAGTAVPGTYRVLVVADALGQVSEQDETNNVGVSGPLPVTAYRPDLTITDVSVPATAAVGRPFTIRQTTRNVGPAPSSGFLVQYYLSTDDTLDAGDVALGTRGFGGLGAGAARTDTATLVLPGNVSAPASYRIIAVAALPGTMPELDTSNNTGVSGPLPVIPYLPDLRIAALTLPASGATGRPLAVRHTIQNLGPAPAAAFTAQFYLSTDGTLDAGDVLLGSRVLGGLGAGGSRTEVSTVTLPANTSAPASYRVIMVVDALGQQAELDETNNTAVSDPLPVALYRPDLRMSVLTAPAAAAVGRSLTVRYTLRNDGPAPSGMFTVRFYLSTDDVFDPGDVLLRSWVFGGLGPGASRNDYTVLTLPANTSVPASYRVIAVVDALDQQTELDETNNVTISDPIAVTLYRPDLSISALTVPASGAAGRPLTIRHTIANTGPAPAGAFTMRFFLSTDDVFDTGDVLLGSRVFSGLGAGASRTDSTTLTLPANTSVPASYRVIAVVDALDQQPELDETNNVAASDPISVTAFLADLAVSDVRLLAAVSAGHALPVRRVVRNVGPAPSGPAVARVFLSADGVLDAGDLALGTCSLGRLASGTVSNALCTVTVPAATVVPSGAQVIVAAAQVDGRPDLDTRNDVMAVPAG